ncbi:MAG: Bor/Iss family lipoprotein [Hyphomicrobiales bacterium]
MKKVKSILAMLAIVAVMATSFSSCMTTRTPVGTYNTDKGTEYKYAADKQYWLFWGLLPIGRTNVATPENGNCEVVTRAKFVDFLIGGVTGGILTSYSIDVNAKR